MIVVPERSLRVQDGYRVSRSTKMVARIIESDSGRSQRAAE